MKYLRKLIEKVHFAIIRRWYLYSSKKRAIILVVHRTTSGKVWENAYNNPPEYLREMFKIMKQRGFEFVTIDEVMSKKPLKPLSVSVVCDDGFADNLHEAIPIFQEFSIPYCIYLPVGFVLREYVSLEAMAEYMFHNSNWKCKGIDKGNTPVENRESIEKAVNTARNAPTLQDIQKAKVSFMNENTTDLINEMDQLYLSLEQVKNMTKDPLCTFGAHAYHHAQMRRMTNKELLHNTKDVKLALENITGKPVKHFAYPFGGFDDNYTREFKAVKSAGYMSGSMFWEGIVTDKFISHGYMIPRIQICSSSTPQENVKRYENLLK
ncbi:MAG: polysaccharide deacetylase family protein [Eubacteriaceae bacterium]